MITTVVKVTLAQFRILEAGGTVGSHTYDPDHCLYMIDDGLVLPQDSGKYIIRTDDDGETYYYDTIDGIPEVLKITNGVLTQAIKDKVTENHLCALQYGEYIYMPQYDSDDIPTYYNCFEGDSHTFHWLEVDWDTLTVEHSELPYVSYVKTLDTTATTAQTPIREPLGDSGSVVLHKISKTGSYNDLLNKPSTFPPSAHTHSASDITTGTIALDRLPVGTAATQVAAGNHIHSAYVNQNAFGNIKVGNTTSTAASTTDTVTFAAGGDLGVSISGKTVTYSVTLPTQLPASDVYSWAKAANKPSYTAGEVGALPTGTTLDDVSDGSTRKLSNYLPLSGGTMTGKLTVQAPIFGYEYSQNNNAAAFIFDKPSSNYTGIGSHAEADTIYFGACNSNGAWVDSYKQKWKFNGTIIEDGTALSNKYLGLTATAADSSKLDGQAASYYLNYNNLTNKPTIPTVYNAKLTIQKNGTTVQTFTANASTDVTANITVPTVIGDLGGWSTIGTVAASTTSIVTTVSASSSNSQIPTALAVWNAVSAATGTVTGVSVNGTTYTPNASGVVPLPSLATRSIGRLNVEGDSTNKYFSTDDHLVLVEGQNVSLSLEASSPASLTISASVANAFSYSGGVLTIDPTKL